MKKQIKHLFIFMLTFALALGFAGHSIGLAEAEAEEFTGYPIETDKTLTWFVTHGPVLNTAYGSWEESPFHSGLNEMVGVDIE